MGRKGLGLLVVSHAGLSFCVKSLSFWFSFFYLSDFLILEVGTRFFLLLALSLFVPLRYLAILGQNKRLPARSF